MSSSLRPNGISEVTYSARSCVVESLLNTPSDLCKPQYQAQKSDLENQNQNLEKVYVTTLCAPGDVVIMACLDIRFFISISSHSRHMFMS